MSLAELTGWCAAALMVTTFASTHERRMRVLAVATNLAFIAYACLAGLPPVLALHLLLLPINLRRCWMLCRPLARWRAWCAALRGPGGVLRLQHQATIAALSMACLLAACGGGGEGAEPAPLVPQDGLQRAWTFEETLGNGERRELDGRVYVGDDDLLRHTTFGFAGLAPAGSDPQADGEIFANAAGSTYWVDAEAPIGDATNPGARIGGAARLVLTQSYRKDALDAAMTLHITRARLEVIDGNGDQPLLAGCPWADAVTAPDTCYQTLSADLSMYVQVMQGSAANPPAAAALYQVMHSAVNLSGWGRHWQHDVTSDFDNIDPRSESGLILKPIFRKADFERKTSSDGLSAEYALREELPVDVDLSLVPLNGEFTVQIWVSAEAVNRRGRESYARARLRDPANASGVVTETTGLTATNRPLVGGPVAPLLLPQACEPGHDPQTAGVLQFSAARYHVPEFRIAEPVILVTRSGGGSGTLLARLRTHDGTALAGTDYGALDRMLVFADGDVAPRVIRLPIVDDEAMQGDRTLRIELTDPLGCGAVGARANADVVIVDDESRVPAPQTFSVGGVVSGLQGGTLTLEEVITGRRVELSTDGSFDFDYTYPDGSAYDVRIVAQPLQPAQVCSVRGGTGTLAGASVHDVAVDCVAAVPNGSLDPGFGLDGKVFEPDLPAAAGVVLQPSGRIVVLAGMTLVGYTTQGQRDATFGSAGVAPVVFNGGSGDEAYGLAMQPDGKLVVVGRTRVGAFFHMAVKRFEADGAADLAFGDGGLTTLDPYAHEGAASRHHYAERAIVADDGSLYVTGVATWLHPTDGLLTRFAAARLHPDGTPASDFGGDGTTTATRQDFEDSWGKTLGLQSDGKLIIGGWSDNARGQRLATFARFLPDGRLDTADPPTTENFGRDGSGFMLVDVGLGGTTVVDMVMLPGDAFMAALSLTVPDAALGSVTKFGMLGTSVHTSLGPADDIPRAMLRQPDGKFVVVGAASSATTTSDFGIVRYRENLSLDTAFGTDGIVRVDFFGAIDAAAAVAQQPDGKLIVAGLARNGTATRLALVRLMP